MNVKINIFTILFVFGHKGSPPGGTARVYNLVLIIHPWGTVTTV